MVFLPENKKYNIIYADPPWKYLYRSKKKQFRSAESHYNVMELKDIMEFPVKEISAENCILFIWVTFPFLENGLKVVNAWGFKYKTVGFTWVKRNKKSNGWFYGMGFYTRSNAEICLIAVKGQISTQSHSVHQIIDTHIEAHSKKPDVTKDRIVELCGDLPRIELFARQKTKGWDAWGDDDILEEPLIKEFKLMDYFK